MTRSSRLSFALAAAVALLVAGACNKPSKESCRKAIENMRSLLGTDHLTSTDVEGEVRRCNGGSKKEAVECAIKATSIAELNACSFMSKPIPIEPDSTGSAAGSAATGSAAPAGSDASKDAGSAAAADSGSAAADSGSAAAATGPGSGSGN